MSPRRAAVPGLYPIDDGDSPPLLGRRCRECGYVFFPPHDFGCESCGAPPERVEPAVLAGAGELRSVAVVHRHAGAGIEVPFTVGEIALDDGPIVRAVIAGSDPPRIGDRVRTRLVITPASGGPPATGAATAGDEPDEKVELRFERATARDGR